jgi:HAMP domain-containing protein
VVAPGARRAARRPLAPALSPIQITAHRDSDGQAIAWSRQTIETIEREQASRRGSRLSD